MQLLRHRQLVGALRARLEGRANVLRDAGPMLDVMADRGATPGTASAPAVLDVAAASSVLPAHAAPSATHDDAGGYGEIRSV